MKNDNPIIDLVEQNGRFVPFNPWRALARKTFASLLRCWGMALWPLWALSMPANVDRQGRLVQALVVVTYLSLGMLLHGAVIGEKAFSSVFVMLVVLAFMLSLVAKPLAQAYMAISGTVDFFHLLLELSLRPDGQVGVVTNATAFMAWEIAATLLCGAVLMHRAIKRDFARDPQRFS